jgi:hypothetical protein
MANMMVALTWDVTSCSLGARYLLTFWMNLMPPSEDIYYPEDRGRRFIHKAGTFLPDYMADIP